MQEQVACWQDFIEQVRGRLGDNDKKLVKNYLKAQARKDPMFVKHHSPPWELSAGDMVLVKRPRGGHKLLPKTQGPFIFIKYPNKYRYTCLLRDM